MKNINKASFYYLIRSKDTLVNLFFLGMLVVAITIMLSKGWGQEKGKDELILLMYAFTLGATMVLANSMLINLTVKDRLSNRFEFFLVSGIDFKDLIKSYSIQMLLISGVIPSIFFLIFNLLVDFKRSMVGFVIMYISILVLGYCVILSLNIFSYAVLRYKLFKNAIYFGSFALLYLVGNFTAATCGLINSLGLDILAFLIGFNIIVSLTLFFLSYRRLAKIDNEELLRVRGEWS